MAKDVRPSPDSHSRAWRSAAPTAAAAPEVSRAAQQRKRLFLVLATMLGLAGAIAALLWLPSRYHEPAFLSIAITEYKDRQYPVNFLAEMDSEALRQHFPGSGPKAQAYESQEKELLLKELGALKNRKDSALVLHLSALARSKQDQVYFLPADAQPDQPETWLPLEDVIGALERCPARHKLLIIDARPFADPRLGVLANDIADHLQDALEKKQSDGSLTFPVLCCCARGQVPLIWEEKQRSAFGYFLDEALRGLADGANPEHKQNQRVSVRELAEFVRERLDRWAPRARHAQQTPLLFGKDDDFDLVVLEHGLPKPEPADPEVPAYPDWLRDGWQLRDQAWTDGTFRLVPRAFRQLEASLLRSEQRWRGGLGSDPERIKTALDADIRDYKKQLRQAQAVRLPEPRSLVQAAAGGRQVDAKVSAAVSDLLAKLKEIPTDKPEEAKKAQDKLLQDFRAKSKGLLHYDLAAVAFEQLLVDDNPTADKVRVLDELLIVQQPQPRFVETLAIHRLAETAAEGKPWQAATIARALRTIREGERAIAADPRTLAWIRPALENANNLRLEGEVLLYKGSPPSAIAKGNQLLEEASSRYRDNNQTIQLIADAYRRHDEALALLPAIVPYLADRPYFDAGQESDWQLMADTVLQLSQLLAHAQSGGPTPIDEVRRHLSELERTLGNLQRPFSAPEVQILVKRIDKGDPQDYLEMQARLACPTLSSRDRIALWKAMQQLGRQLEEKQQEGPGEFARATRRATFALGSLKVAGLPRLEQLEKKEYAAAAVTGKAAAWEPLAEKTRLAWTVEVPEEIRKTKDVALRDRIARLLPPWDRLPTTGLDENPAGQPRRQASKVYYQWLAEQYEQTSRKLGDVPAAGFYTEAAADFRRFAP
jgi:hypothetical protein